MGSCAFEVGFSVLPPDFAEELLLGAWWVQRMALLPEVRERASPGGGHLSPNQPSRAGSPALLELMDPSPA